MSDATFPPATVVPLYGTNVAIIDTGHSRIALTLMSPSAVDGETYIPAESVTVNMDLTRARALLAALSASIEELDARMKARASA